MNFLISPFLFAALLTGSLNALARVGERNAVEPRIVRLKLSLVKAGQPDIGLKEVEIKLNHFLKDFDLTLAQFLKLREKDPANAKVQSVLASVDFSRFLSKRNIEVVRDPKGGFQVFDGHHLWTTLTLLEVEYVDVELHEDFYKPDSTRPMAKQMKDYRTYMMNHNLVRLMDRHGRMVGFDDLPGTPEEMKNDPFRSLAWILKKIDIFADLDKPMQEFEWATFLRKEFRKRKWSSTFHSNAEFMTAVNRAINILSDTDEDVIARLPGSVEIPGKSKKGREKKSAIMERCEHLLYDFET